MMGFAKNREHVQELKRAYILCQFGENRSTISMLVNFLLAVSRRAETPTDENVLAGGGFHIQHAGKLVARYNWDPLFKCQAYS